MPQFTPSARRYVRSDWEEIDHIHQVQTVGPGLIGVYTGETSRDGTPRLFTDLAEEHGWYLAFYKHQDRGSLAVIMPMDGEHP